jgi:hypothetical protein
LRPKADGQQHRKIDKVALKGHVQDRSQMYVHERATIFDVHTRAISGILKTVGIVKKERQYKERCPMKRRACVEKLAAKQRMFGFKHLIYRDETACDAHTHTEAGSKEPW